MSTINLDDLTLGQIKQLQSISSTKTSPAPDGLSDHIGKNVIVRTENAGVWFGKLVKKSGREVILDRARRMWRWHAVESISLSGVARYGINQSQSKICGPLDCQWMEAVEIILPSEVAEASILEAKEAHAS